MIRLVHLKCGGSIKLSGSFPIISRSFMNSKDIQKFKNKGFHTEDEKLKETNERTSETFQSNSVDEDCLKEELKTRICKNDNCKYASPLEVSQWSFIYNSRNIKPIYDVLQYTRKKMKDDLLSAYELDKIMNRYNVVINTTEEDVTVDNDIKNYIHDFLSSVEKDFVVFKDVFELLKEKESLVGYSIYKHMKVIHALPTKLFWKYQNSEDLNDYEIYHEPSEEESEFSNSEYLFSQVDLSKMDQYLNEQTLDSFPVESEHDKENSFSEKIEPVFGTNKKDSFNEFRRSFSSISKSYIEVPKVLQNQSNYEMKSSAFCTLDSSSQRERYVLKNEKNTSNVKSTKWIDPNDSIPRNKNEREQTGKTLLVEEEEEDFLHNIKILNEKNIKETTQKKSFRTTPLPISSLSRAGVFGKMFIDIAKNSSIEFVKNILKNNTEQTILTEKNAEIIATGLSKMRGVVLKLGQMISLQDDYISPILGKALKIVHNSADVMPKSHLVSILKKELGEDFESKFEYFNYDPFASASIGQVHEGILKENKHRVAIKVQYPGVYESIDSDIKNLLFINQYTNLIVKNLYLENLCNVIRMELKSECDYINEAKYYIFFKSIFKNSKYFYVPSVYSDYCTRRVLVTSYVQGISIDDVIATMPSSVCDSIGHRIIYLCLHELFVLKVMNTDPNLGNFLYNYETNQLGLIDFGAARSYKNEFVDEYIRLVKSSIEENEDKIYHYSYMLSFFNGKENEEMKNSHIQSVILVGEPFKHDTYDFGKGGMAEQIYDLLPKIISNRLVPPRSEIYTLHRKLSGSYLLCMRLKAKVRAKHIFDTIYKNYKFSIEDSYQSKRMSRL